jgi:hypothetical protein
MRQNASIVAAFGTHRDAENGIERLASSGFDPQALSIVATGERTEERIVGLYSAGDRVRFWGKLGLSWGGFWGVVIGGVLFATPAPDGFEIADFLASALVAGVEGAFIIGGLGALGAVFYSFGRPVGSVVKYGYAAKAGSFLVVAKGSARVAAQAKEMLSPLGPQLPATQKADAADEPTPFAPSRAWVPRLRFLQ